MYRRTETVLSTWALRTGLQRWVRRHWYSWQDGTEEPMWSSSVQQNCCCDVPVTSTVPTVSTLSSTQSVRQDPGVCVGASVAVRGRGLASVTGSVSVTLGTLAVCAWTVPTATTGRRAPTTAPRTAPASAQVSPLSVHSLSTHCLSTLCPLSVHCLSTVSLSKVHFLVQSNLVHI